MSLWAIWSSLASSRFRLRSPTSQRNITVLVNSMSKSGKLRLTGPTSPGGTCCRMLYGSSTQLVSRGKNLVPNMKGVAAGCDSKLAGPAELIFLRRLTACQTTVQVCTLCRGWRVVGAVAPCKLAGPSVLSIKMLSWSLWLNNAFVCAPTLTYTHTHPPAPAFRTHMKHRRAGATLQKNM